MDIKISFNYIYLVKPDKNQTYIAYRESNYVNFVVDPVVHLHKGHIGMSHLQNVHITEF
jgi:hypothetical protein